MLAYRYNPFDLAFDVTDMSIVLAKPRLRDHSEEFILKTALHLENKPRPIVLITQGSLFATWV